MRIHSIDLFRFIAAICVVIIHVAPFLDTIYGQVVNQAAQFAVPFFFVVAGYFFHQKTRDNYQILLSYLFYYGSRLLIIYVAWYVVYAFWPLYSPDNWINPSVA